MSKPSGNDCHLIDIDGGDNIPLLHESQIVSLCRVDISFSMAVGLLLFVNGIPHYHWCANVMKLIQNGMSWEEICNHTLKVPTPYYDLNQQLHQKWN